MTTTKGRCLHEAASRSGCEYHSTGKVTTTNPNKVPDLLNFFITKKISNNYIKIEEAFNLTSDQSIIMTLSENIITKECNPTLTNKTINWKQFNEEISNRIDLNVP